MNAGKTAKVAVEDNSLKGIQVNSLLQQIAIAERRLDGPALDAEMRRIRTLAAKMASDNFKEIEGCEKNPTAACLNKMKVEYGNVDFKKLKDKYRLYPGTVNTINGYELQAIMILLPVAHLDPVLVSCSGTLNLGCI